MKKTDSWSRIWFFWLSCTCIYWWVPVTTFVFYHIGTNSCRKPNFHLRFHISFTFKAVIMKKSKNLEFWEKYWFFEPTFWFLQFWFLIPFTIWTEESKFYQISRIWFRDSVYHLSQSYRYESGKKFYISTKTHHLN